MAWHGLPYSWRVALLSARLRYTVILRRIGCCGGGTCRSKCGAARVSTSMPVGCRWSPWCVTTTASGILTSRPRILPDFSSAPICYSSSISCQSTFHQARALPIIAIMSAPMAHVGAPELEKSGGVEHLERTISEDSDVVNNAHIDALTPEEQKKVIRRVDRRLVLTLGGMYCVSLMDRTNTVGQSSPAMEYQWLTCTRVSPSSQAWALT
jgi:hypothetical protein